MQKQAILAAVLYPMVNVVIFGFGAAAVMAFFTASAATLLPIVIVTSILISVPISWFLAPRLSIALSAKRQAGK